MANTCHDEFEREFVKVNVNFKSIDYLFALFAACGKSAEGDTRQPVKIGAGQVLDATFDVIVEHGLVLNGFPFVGTQCVELVLVDLRQIARQDVVGCGQLHRRRRRHIVVQSDRQRLGVFNTFISKLHNVKFMGNNNNQI